MDTIRIAEAESLIWTELDELPPEHPFPPFFFIVGAGISTPAVPLAAEIAEHCRLKAQEYDRAPTAHFDRKIDEYSTCFRLAYPGAAARQHYLRGLIQNKPVSSANTRLATLLADGTVARITVTPNFDDFLSRALEAIDTRYDICDRAQTTDRIEPHSPQRVQVVHVHGSYSHYDCSNLTAEIDRVATSSGTMTMGFLLDTILRWRTPLVLGYSGWESDVIMSALRRRLASTLPCNLYWFCHIPEGADALPDWLRHHPNVVVVTPDSDEKVLDATTVLDALARAAGRLRKMRHEPRAPLSAFARTVPKPAYTEWRGTLETAMQQRRFSSAARTASEIAIETLAPPELEALEKQLLTLASSGPDAGAYAVCAATLKRVHQSMLAAGMIDDTEWHRRITRLLLEEARRSQPEAAIALYDEIYSRFRDVPDLGVQEIVSRALTAQLDLRWHAQHDDSSEVIADLILSRHARVLTPAEDYASALAVKAEIVLAESRYGEGLALLDELLAADAPAKLHLQALVERAVALVGVDRAGDALAQIEDVLSDPQAGHELSPELLLKAHTLHASLLELSGRTGEALQGLDSAESAMRAAGMPLTFVLRLVLIRAQTAERIGDVDNALADYRALSAAARASPLPGTAIYVAQARRAIDRLIAATSSSPISGA